MSDDPILAAMAAMEARLMGRINALQENMIERFRAVDAMFAAQNETTRSNNTLLTILVNNTLNYGKRITDLEGRKP